MNPRTAEQITLISKLLELYRQLLEKLMEQKENKENMNDKVDKLDQWCDAITSFEGWY